jgi:hypothetical protein
LFNISGSVCADVNRLSEERLERRAISMGGPELELGVAVGAHFQEIVFAPVVKFELGDDLLVAALQAFRQPKQRGQHANLSTIAAFQIAHPFV